MGAALLVSHPSPGVSATSGRLDIVHLTSIPVLMTALSTGMLTGQSGLTALPQGATAQMLTLLHTYPQGLNNHTGAEAQVMVLSEICSVNKSRPMLSETP